MLICFWAHSREPKVNQFDFVVFAQHYIFRLDISMDNSLAVTVEKSLRKLFDPDSAMTLLKRILPETNMVDEILTLNELVANILVSGVVITLIVFCDVRMI